MSPYMDKKVTVDIEINALQDAAWMARGELRHRKEGVPLESSIADRSLNEIIAVSHRASHPGGCRAAACDICVKVA